MTRAQLRKLTKKLNKDKPTEERIKKAKIKLPTKARFQKLKSPDDGIQNQIGISRLLVLLIRLKKNNSLTRETMKEAIIKEISKIKNIKKEMKKSEKAIYSGRHAALGTTHRIG